MSKLAMVRQSMSINRKWVFENDILITGKKNFVYSVYWGSSSLSLSFSYVDHWLHHKKRSGKKRLSWYREEATVQNDWIVGSRLVRPDQVTYAVWEKWSDRKTDGWANRKSDKMTDEAWWMKERNEWTKRGINSVTEQAAYCSGVLWRRTLAFPCDETIFWWL